ncbi:MAG TPA: T9SS type A sorting domain-containing protein [Flavobacteriales bacterium]|nr:T9SS type A sorting domain-containing protein [Flavobacteriales bacterium]
MKNILLSFLALTTFLAFTSTSQAQADICPGADVLIETGDVYFAPSELEITVGTTVGWVNIEGTHNANGDISVLTSMSFGNPESFHFPLIEGSKMGVCIGTHTFTIEGVYNYDCSGYGHAANGMVASLTVVAGGGDVQGCMDAVACNFNADATVDDGSCAFEGMTCDDGDPATTDEVYDAECNCSSPDAVGGVGTELSFKLFPNPASSQVTIKNPGKERVTIFNTLGSKVYSTFEEQVTIDVSAYARGIYTVKVGAHSSQMILE